MSKGALGWFYDVSIYNALDERDLMKVIKNMLNVKCGRYWILSRFCH
jgi:hypothetical protein